MYNEYLSWKHTFYDHIYESFWHRSDGKNFWLFASRFKVILMWKNPKELCFSFVCYLIFHFEKSIGVNKAWFNKTESFSTPGKLESFFNCFYFWNILEENIAKKWILTCDLSLEYKRSSRFCFFKTEIHYLRFLIMAYD